MQKFQFPPKPIAILAILALLAVPLVSGLLLQPLVALPTLFMFGADGARFLPRVPAWLTQAAYKRQFARFTPEQRLLIGADGEVVYDGISHLRRLAAARPDSLVIQTRWTLYQLSNKANLPLAERLALLEKIEKTDPENSIWPLQRGYYLMSESAKIDDLELAPGAPKGTRAPQKLTISNQQQFDQGIAEIRRALSMPKFESRYAELLQMQLAAFGPPQSLSDGISLVAMSAGSLLPELYPNKMTAEFTVLYGAELLRQGKVEEAKPLLRAWLPLAEKLLAAGDDNLISILVVGAVLRFGQEEENAWQSAGQVDQADLVAKLRKQLCQPHETFKKTKTSVEYETFVTNAGILPSQLLPALRGINQPPLAEAFAWRQLEYLQCCEQGWLMAGTLVLSWLSLLGLLLAYGWRRSASAETDFCSWHKLARLVALTLLPLALYLLVERGCYVREIVPAGHSALVHPLLGLAMLALALVLSLVLPLVCCRWCRLAERGLLALSVLLLAGCALVWVSTTIEAPRLIAQATAMRITASGTQVEAEAAGKLKAEILKALQECRP